MTIEDFERLIRLLPPHPVAPENRGLAKLAPSAYLPRGQSIDSLRIPEITGHLQARDCAEP